MKLVRILTSFASAGVALAFTLALILPAQEPPVDESKEGLRVVDQSTAELESEAAAVPTTVKSTVAEVEGRVAEVRAEAATVGAEAEQMQAEAAAAAVAAENDRSTSEAKSRRRAEDEIVRFLGKVVVRDGRYVREAVSILGSVLVEKGGEIRQSAVAILGDTVIDGEIGGEAVSILGNMTVNGRVGGESVAVLGDTVINGEVSGEVVNVLGRVQLGPEAHLKGNLIVVGGSLDRAPGARVDGETQEMAFMGDNYYVLDGIKAWIRHCLLMGRPLAFGEHLGWAWGLALGALVCYFFIALLFPKAVVKCAETLETRPGLSIVAAILTLLLAPILAIVLSVTVVGPVLLGIFLFFASIFGKVVFFTWFGRRMMLPMGLKLPALAVLAGGVVTLFIYVIPVVGFLFQVMAGLIGLGVVIYTIILMVQADRVDRPKRAKSGPAPVPPISPAPGVAASVGTSGGLSAEASTEAEDTDSTATAPSADLSEPPPLRTEPQPSSTLAAIQYSTLPRAGFWIRLAATLLDIMLIGIVLGMMDNGFFQPTDYFPLMAATYFVAFWALKGTTIGGVVCGLKVVRLDDRPVDWSVALVRGLGGFLSLFVAGLGFIWVAFDDECQSWHDKISGTTIVRVPRGISLI
jgi:uncharacterized RDD family membrane protein YckC/cytoskeletal protein CcmA (bactofilin family)